MKLPIVSWADVVKALNKIGFEISRQSGSHIILINKTKEDKITVVIPKHRELATGTLLSIISQSGLNRDKFLDLLKTHSKR